MAANDLQPLAEKLQTAEQLSLEDFTAVLNAYRDAMADGRINFFEALKIVRAVINLFSEFTSGIPVGSGPTFGFQKQE